VKPRNRDLSDPIVFLYTLSERLAALAEISATLAQELYDTKQNGLTWAVSGFLEDAAKDAEDMADALSGKALTECRATASAPAAAPLPPAMSARWGRAEPNAADYVADRVHEVRERMAATEATP